MEFLKFTGYSDVAHFYSKFFMNRSRITGICISFSSSVLEGGTDRGEECMNGEATIIK